MNLKEAKELVAEKKYLIGTLIDDKPVSDIVIVPKSSGALTAIVLRLSASKPYDDILESHSDFEVIALVDFDSYVLGGNLQTEITYQILSR